jgi:adenine C2-methylase RlmN of 23S rRNA A2503 and tRNA A37
MRYIESKNKNNFIKILNDYNIFPEIYSTDGVDIGASCGQLNSKLC